VATDQRTFHLDTDGGHLRNIRFYSALLICPHLFIQLRSWS